MKTIELYRPEDLARLTKKRKIRRVLLLTLTALAAGVCVLLCCLVNTRNAARMELAVILTSILSGWVLITLRYELLVLARREAEHTAHMLAGPRVTRTGILDLTDVTVRIPGSVRIRRLTLQEGKDVRRLSVDASRLRMLGELPRQVTVSTVHDFVVALEETP
ncbi:MAG: hypothetical protein IJJ99_01775 [Oscillospiraceae bacterium]|nr:hypothetical protein [Oscillospiraceae bacterium]